MALLEQLVAEHQRNTRRSDLEVRCEGVIHRVRGVHDPVAVDHDLDAEQVLAALGGTTPACLSVVRAWPRATLEGIRVALDDPGDNHPSQDIADLTAAVAALPAEQVAWRVAELLLAATARASPAVRSRSAQLGLHLLSPPHLADEARHARFRRAIRWPRFDIGARDWDAAELDVLATWLTPTAGGRFRVDYLPRRTAERSVVLRCVADQLDTGARYSDTDLRQTLRRHTRKPAEVRDALVAAGLLVEDRHRFTPVA